MLNTLCVFCASSSKVDVGYKEAAESLADICINNNIHVLYGGGGVGLMGALANRILAGKGRITGIIPDFMKKMEWAHTDVTEMIVVEDMRERKKRMIENVDAVVALPGGVGTLEELLEVITLKQLGRFTKPIIIINTDGFYDSLLQLFNEMVEKKFMHDYHRQIWSVIDKPDDLLSSYSASVLWDASAINKAAL
jgi:uncharacterized protein (TIGR00730 family)